MTSQLAAIGSLRALVAKMYGRPRRRTVTDRRRWPRYPAAWIVRLFVDDTNTILTKTVDVSLHGLRLALNDQAGALLLRPGERYRFAVVLPDSEAQFVRVGEVRHAGKAGVGFETVEALPEAVASVLSLLNGTIATSGSR